MIEWTGSGWGSRKLSKPLRVMAEKKVSMPNTKGTPVQKGGQTGNEGQEVVLTFVQDFSPKDKPLPDGSTYRIVLTFMGQPADKN